MIEPEELRKAFAQRFHEIANVKLSNEDWLSVPDTESFRKSFYQFVATPNADVTKMFVPRSGFGIVHAVLRWLNSRFGDESGALFHCYDRSIGAMRCRLDEVVNAFPHVWELVREDFCFAANDMSFGLMMELNYFDQEGRSCPDGTFELCIWGTSLPSDDEDMVGCTIHKLGAMPDLERLGGD